MSIVFLEKLRAASLQNRSLLCVGLDTELSALPEGFSGLALPQFEFNKKIIDATKDLVSAYKPNSAFYEAEGTNGLEALIKTIEYIPDHIPVILDAKRGDIGNTSRMYAKAAFEVLGADAVTVHGYMGSETIAPFLEFPGKAVFVLVKTSNKSAGEIQDLKTGSGAPVYMQMAARCAEWNKQFDGRCGVVVGATYPEDLKAVRSIIGDAPILLPGLGAQGGDVEKSVHAGTVSRTERLIVNSSRGIIFASNGSDFEERAREEALKLRDLINSFL